MRTLKIFVIAASLFLFATPTIANTNYPPEMPDIKNAPIQFVCKAPSSLFVKVYLNPEKLWRVVIAGRDHKEMRIELSSDGIISDFVFIPSANEWKKIFSEVEGIDKYILDNSAEADDLIIFSCVKSHLRSRRLL